MDIDEPDKNDEILVLRNDMLDHISLNNEAHFKSQQRNEPDLSVSEKRQIAENVLDNSPGSFLSRFGKYLKECHLEYFTPLAIHDYEVNYYVNTIKDGFKKPTTKSVVRNRRLEALRRLSDEGQYFSDNEMRKRDPVMYEHLVGQYLSKEEKQQNLADRLNDSEGFTNFLLTAIDENEIKETLKNEPQIEEESEYESDDSYEGANPIDKKGLWGEWHSVTEESPPKKTKNNKYVKPKELTDEEKGRLMNEFRSHMYSDFLSGNDKEFDYSKVDSNHDYDDLEMLEIDQQDKYFDSETPETISKGDESSDSSSLELQPPRTLNQRMADLCT